MVYDRTNLNVLLDHTPGGVTTKYPNILNILIRSVVDPFCVRARYQKGHQVIEQLVPSHSSSIHLKWIDRIE